MDQRQRIAAQRVLVCEAIGKLKAVSQLFGTETNAVSNDLSAFNDWDRAIKDFEEWVFSESPIA